MCIAFPLIFLVLILFLRFMVFVQKLSSVHPVQKGRFGLNLCLSHTAIINFCPILLVTMLMPCEFILFFHTSWLFPAVFSNATCRGSSCFGAKFVHQLLNHLSAWLALCDALSTSLSPCCWGWVSPLPCPSTHPAGWAHPAAWASRCVSPLLLSFPSHQGSAVAPRARSLPWPA